MMVAPADPSGGRSGVLVVRAWVEASDTGHLRARVVRSVDVDRSEVTTAAGSVEEVLAIVEDWLGSLLGPDD